MKQLNIEEKQKISYCISTELRDQQILINIKKVKERVVPSTELKDEPIALVSYGPSLKDTWQELKKFKYIMTCSGAHKFLIDKGIIPTHHLELEPREHKIKMLGVPQKETEYLIASTIHPKYLDALEGYNVKLWHIFASDDDAERILPKGEWKITGGSSVGLRTMTMARFLGFTDLHIFGMDGSFAEGKTHSDQHPNAPKEFFETEYNGKKYLTTPSILFCAKETFKELDQLPDIKTTFYGNGLVQDMAKNYIPSPKSGTNLAFNSPELISKEYIDLNYQLHQSNPTYGMGGSKYKDTVLKLSKELKTTSILDYGCGKGMLAKELSFPIWEYDPAIPEKSTIPKPADIVICTDVLEHIEQDKLPFVLSDLKRCVKQVGYFVISTRKAIKTYANGKNAHSIIQGKDWWEKKINKYFDIGTIIDKEKECELHVVVGPKTIKQPDITVVEKDDKKFKFYTPNDTTKWRASTLFTKEPSTIEWINSMKPGEVLFDVGANIGSYSVYAGVKGVKVYSFEPEAENYALLIKNLNLNGIEPNAYCMAISDEIKTGLLYAGQQDVGGACHTFNEKVGFDLKVREEIYTQGCFGMPLQEMVKNGLPQPDYIKIDVDGLEHKVLTGAWGILNNCKSLLIEINPSLSKHLEIIKELQDNFNFIFDQKQVDSVTRKEGPFKGCAEYIFYKNTSSLETHLCIQIEKTKVITEPYPYMFIEDIFPEDIYLQILANLPSEYKTLEEARGTKGYPERFVATPKDDFWNKINSQLLSGKLKKVISDKFGIDYFCNEDLLLIKDKPGYKIGVHRDRPSKVISALFYLPPFLEGDDEGQDSFDAGTTIYVPKKEGFTCEVGKHYGFDDFNKLTKMPFRPNSLFIFLNTDHSFHGVEPTDMERDVLLYNLNKP